MTQGRALYGVGFAFAVTIGLAVLTLLSLTRRSRLGATHREVRF